MSQKGTPRTRNARKPDNGFLYFNPQGTCCFCKKLTAVSFNLGKWKCGDCFNKLKCETPYRGKEL